MSKSNRVKISEITPAQVSSICDHTFLLRPESYREKGISPVKKWEEEFNKFLKESISFTADPFALCVKPETVEYTKKFLKENKKEDKIKIASVVGFPQGAFYDLKWKLVETGLAINAGAEEIDFVMNYESLKNKNLESVQSEMRAIGGLCKSNRKLSKIILETSELTDNEIITACKIAKDSGIDFVKTSSGFTAGGATSHHLKIMRDNFPYGVKMSGGVSTDNLKELLYAASGRTDGYIDLDPLKIRIGESSLLTKLFYSQGKISGY